MMTAKSKSELNKEIQSLADDPTSCPPELEERIRFRAFQLYDQRGGIIGHDLDDWLEAEREVMASSKIGVAA
jgi:regulation of enolase protein 1 (concanavalin A-like superfamily)